MNSTRELLAGGLLAAGALMAAAQAGAQTTARAPGQPPRLGAGLDIGAVLDGSLASDELALGTRPKGFGLGHNELTIGASIDPLFAGRLTAVAHSHDSDVEWEIEEAYMETTSLPAGLQVRGGRFLSALGYLNEQHMHADDFIERPLLYRAFLGSHYFDDGLRLQWVAPTRLYWRVTAEAMSGQTLLEESENKPVAGAYTLGTKVGGDLGISHSWQLGLSYLRNRLDPALDGHDHDHDHGAHEHAHGARFTGRNMFIADAVWKWAPNGNNRERQLRLSGEYARVTDLNEYASSSDIHEAWYLSAVYRFAPQWEAGLRFDELKVREPHGDHFHAGRLREASVALTWKPSHFSLLRLQWTDQRDRGGFDDAGQAVFLQYVMSLGAHGAHAF
ncbi:MAG TPA: hypothetical protein PK177_08980 [Burkholderiaceae bacterium]|nr:hypothetical protein [Burkholderiaceae bacterium]